MAMPNLRKRAVHLHERMDDPDCDPALLARTFEQFAGVNRLISGWHDTYRQRIRPLLSAETPSSLLDIGCGGGDIARAIAGWAAADGLQLGVTGIDPDVRAIAAAGRAPNPHGVTFLRADSSELVDRALRFDVVISNHVLHHLSAEQFADLLIDCELLCRGLSIHSDIRRSRLAYAEYWLATLALFRGSFVREDGLISIRRSYTAAELRVAARRDWVVESQAPFRLLLSYAASAAAKETESDPVI